MDAPVGGPSLSAVHRVKHHDRWQGTLEGPDAAVFNPPHLGTAPQGPTLLRRRLPWAAGVALVAAAACGADLESAFRRLDRDGDGTVSRTEMAGDPRAVAFDRNGDGIVTRAEAGLPQRPEQAGKESAAAAATPAGLNVLLVGHSLVQPAIAPLARIASAAGIRAHAVTAHISGSTSPRAHWEMPAPQQQVRPSLESGRFDAVVIGAYYGDRAADWENYVALGRAHRPGLRVFVQDAWPDIGHGDGPAPDLPDYARQVANINATSGANAATVNAHHPGALSIVPVGNAMLLLRAWMEAGMAPGLSRVRGDLYRDNIHPTPVVGVLEGYVYYACLYRACPIGLPNAFAAQGVPDELNAVLQRVAWLAVTQHPLSGVGDG